MYCDKKWYWLGVSVMVLMFSGLAVAQESNDSVLSESVMGGPIDQYLNPQKLVVLSAEISGIIDGVHYQPGDFVRKDDVLIQLNTDMVNLRVQRLQNQIDMDTSREEARINLEYRTSNLEIVQKLFDTMLETGRVGSRKELEESKQLKQIAELGKTKADLNLKLLNLELQENLKILDRHSIRAPFDGVIVPFSSVQYLDSRNLKRMEQGEAVQAGQVVMALMKVDQLRVEWTLPVEQIDQVHIGRKVRVVMQSPTESEVEATVVYISPTIELTEEFKFEVEFSNPPIRSDNLKEGEYRYQYRPGMRARVIFE